MPMSKVSLHPMLCGTEWTIEVENEMNRIIDLMNRRNIRFLLHQDKNGNLIPHP
jgi:hypothetical protein